MGLPWFRSRTAPDQTVCISGSSASWGTQLEPVWQVPPRACSRTVLFDPYVSIASAAVRDVSVRPMSPRGWDNSDQNRAIIELRGAITEQDIARVRTAGYGDGEITEIIAHVGLNVFTNYFNRAVHTEIDFPIVTAGQLV